MYARPEQKCYEVLNIPISYAGANPGTVVIVHFDADAALTAVESPRWSQMLARVAITQFIMSLPWLDEAMFENVALIQALFMVAGRQVLELVKTVVLVDGIS